MAFANDMKKIIKKVEKDAVNKVVIPATEMAVMGVAKITPKDTGNLTANWNITLNRFDGKYRELFDFLYEPSMSMDIVYSKLNEIKRSYKLGDDVNMTNNAPYADDIFEYNKSRQLQRGELQQVLMDIEQSINKGQF
jgi:hypothetical protein